MPVRSMTVRLLAGQSVPLNPDNLNVVTNFGSPHAHVSTQEDMSYLTSLSSTLQNMDSLLFSSYWFDYMEVNTSGSASLTFPQRNYNFSSGGKKSSGNYNPYSGFAEYVITTHSAGYTPAFTCYDDNNVINSTFFLESGTSFRVLQVIGNSSQLKVLETYFVYTNTLPSLTKTFNFQVFKANVESGGTYTTSNYGLYMTDNRVIFGQGKFDSNKRYLYQDDGGYPLLCSNSMTNEVGYYVSGASIRNFVSRFTINKDNSQMFYRTNVPNNDDMTAAILPNIYAPGLSRKIKSP